jgi:hypothetical protein
MTNTDKALLARRVELHVQRVSGLPANAGVARDPHVRGSGFSIPTTPLSMTRSKPAQGDPKPEALVPTEAEREPGPPPTWPGPVGALLAAAAIGGGFLGVGVNGTLRAILAGVLVVGVVLVAWAVQSKQRSPSSRRSRR